MQGSEIYIKAYTLKNIHQTYIKQTLFARALMNAIFKASALSSCCLMGKSKSKNIDPQEKRPGLFKPAVESIISK